MNLSAIALLLVSLMSGVSSSDFELPPPFIAMDKPVEIPLAPESPTTTTNVPAKPAFAEEGNCDSKILALQDRIRQLDCEYEQSRNRELSRLRCLLRSLQEERRANELAEAERARQADLKAKQEAEEQRIEELRLLAINEAKEREAEAAKIEMERAAQAEKMRLIEQERREQEALAAAKRKQEEEALRLRQAEEKAKQEMAARRLEEEEAKLQRKAEELQQQLKEEERARREAEALKLKQAADAKLQEAAKMQSAADALLSPKAAAAAAKEEIIVVKKAEPKKTMVGDIEHDLLMQAQQLTNTMGSLTDSLAAEPLPVNKAPKAQRRLAWQQFSAGTPTKQTKPVHPSQSPTRRPAQKAKSNLFAKVFPPHHPESRTRFTTV